MWVACHCLIEIPRMLSNTYIGSCRMRRNSPGKFKRQQHGGNVLSRQSRVRNDLIHCERFPATGFKGFGLSRSQRRCVSASMRVGLPRGDRYTHRQRPRHTRLASHPVRSIDDSLCSSGCEESRERRIPRVPALPHASLSKSNHFVSRLRRRWFLGRGH